MVNCDVSGLGGARRKHHIVFSQDICANRKSARSGQEICPKRGYHWRRGIAVTWVAIFIVLFTLLIGLALDFAKVFLVAHQLQNGADSAALSGARWARVDADSARQEAIRFALLNYAAGAPIQLADNSQNLPNGDVVVGKYDRRTQTFTATTDRPNAVMVVARRTESSLGGPVSLVFGPIVGFDTSNISRYAIAMAWGGTGAGLIALSPEGTGLHINGDVTLNVNDGAIQVNSEDDEATVIKGQPEIVAAELNVCGDISATGGFEYPPTEELAVQSSAPPIPDPLAWLPEPTWDPADDLSPSPGETITIDVNNSPSVTFEPGYYSGGFYITGGDVTFKPGIYILEGGLQDKGGFVVKGSANIIAEGVMLFIHGNGQVYIGGTGSIRVTPIDFESFSYPPEVPTYYEEVTIFQDRQNTNPAHIRGTGLLDLEGTLYFPENHCDLTGTGDGFGNQLIASTVEVSGTGDITINYDGRNKSPANKSFLVE